eukprot:2428290-Amphidinium_carterae.1
MKVGNSNFRVTCSIVGRLIFCENGVETRAKKLASSAVWAGRHMLQEARHGFERPGWFDLSAKDGSQ